MNAIRHWWGWLDEDLPVILLIGLLRLAIRLAAAYEREP